MAPKFVPFEDVEALASIDQLAVMLGLDPKRSGNQLRCACPVHGGDHRTLAISPQVKSRRGSEGVFYCQADKSGGDRIGLVAHVMEMGQQDAAFFIASQFGMQIANSNSDGTVNSTVRKDRATAPPAQKKATEKAAPKPHEFDPQAFAAKLVYSEEVAALGVTEEEAESLGIGFYRGKLYQALRYANGQTAGYSAFANGELKLPSKLLPQTSNVVRLKRA